MNKIAAVILEREGRDNHSYRVDGEYVKSLALWRLLERPAMQFIEQMKREYPHLAFAARLRVEHSYVNDALVPELVLDVRSANDPALAQSLLQTFVDEHEHLLTEEE
jgi:hypothetical protein